MGGLIASPAIVRIESLMPVRALPVFNYYSGYEVIPVSFTEMVTETLMHHKARMLYDVIDQNALFRRLVDEAEDHPAFQLAAEEASGQAVALSGGWR
jgi:hypothetical protein